MRRLLRIRLVLVLFALVLAPAAVLPFAAQMRSEWTKFWEPEPEFETPLPLLFAGSPYRDDRFSDLNLPPGEWCGTFSAPAEPAPVVIERLTTEPDPFADGIGFEEATSAPSVPPLVVEP